ncbi:MAG: hypothetical protein ACJAW7_002432 [Candidatus Azotimanducaceae bacterium]|jgi:hypothetical protein
MTFIEITAVLGNLGEFIGAIAVVVTLFYVGLQVKHSKEATEANTRSLEEGSKIALVNAFHARAVESSASFRMQADSPVAAIELKYRSSGVESLTEEEAARLMLFHMSQVWRLDSSYFAYQNGLLPEYLTTLEFAIRNYGPVWRDLGVHISRESFKSEVNRIMAMVDKEAAAEA